MVIQGVEWVMQGWSGSCSGGVGVGGSYRDGVGGSYRGGWGVSYKGGVGHTGVG